MLDISKVKSVSQIAELGEDVKIEAPDGSGSFTVTVRGTQSDSYQKHFKKMFREEQRKLLAQKRKPTDEVLDLSEIFEKMVEDCIARVIKWDGLSNGNKPLECTPENIKMVIGLYGNDNPSNAFIVKVREASEELGKI